MPGDITSWISGSGQGHEGYNDAPFLAADTIQELSDENEKLREALISMTGYASLFNRDSDYIWRALKEQVQSLLGDEQ
jgi:hypothetical protein